MAPKTLLLVFIHGFQGSDDTFGNFPSHICALLSHRLPHISVTSLVFPTFETRGDLNLTVQKFRSWLEEKVIDIEVTLGTPSPTVDPGVAVIVCGHSMGGIVGAEAVCGIAGEKVLDGALGESEDDNDDRKAELFPFVQGLLAFDTPYLGISPGVVAHGAEGHWNQGKAWYEGAVGVWGALAGTAAVKSAAAAADAKPLPPIPPKDEKEKQAQKAGWANGWGRTALLAGAGLAATAGLGTAAYLTKETITSSFSWVGSHLEFVGSLARPEELRRRLERMVKVSGERRVGFANMYTLLALDKGGNYPGRTFCNVPADRGKLRPSFKEARNEKAGDEIAAHIGMFVPKDNPGYYAMSEQSLELIISWIDNDWSQGATEVGSSEWR